MPVDWYNRLERDGGEHPADAAVRQRLAASAEYDEVTARVLAGTTALQAPPDEEQRAAWLVLDADVNHRSCLVAEAHFDAGVEHGLQVAAAGEQNPDPVAAVKALAAALVRAAERLSST